MPVVTMKNLLEAGVHFGHQTRRWNPKMKPYIFTERNGIYILDLQRTLRELEHSYKFARSVASHGGTVLFVGTKKQAQEPIQSEAERAGHALRQPTAGSAACSRTSSPCAAASKRMEELEAMDEDGRMAALPKKEQLLLRKELGKLQANLNGVRDMRELPAAIFVVDTKREDIAIKEAQPPAYPDHRPRRHQRRSGRGRLRHPGNDDAIRSVGLMCRVIADAIIEGRGGQADVPEARPVARAPRSSSRPRRSARSPRRAHAAEPSSRPSECVETESLRPQPKSPRPPRAPAAE